MTDHIGQHDPACKRCHYPSVPAASVLDVPRLRRALHRWKTERDGDPTPHTEWWANRCHDCADDADAIAYAYSADGVAARHISAADGVNELLDQFGDAEERKW